jgi:hypothetical protein
MTDKLRFGLGTWHHWKILMRLRLACIPIGKQDLSSKMLALNYVPNSMLKRYHRGEIRDNPRTQVGDQKASASNNLGFND